MWRMDEIDMCVDCQSHMCYDDKNKYQECDQWISNIRFGLRLVTLAFEYSEDKNQANIRKHGISFRNAARVFFDYDRIEMYDEENSDNEERYDTICDTSAGNLIFGKDTIIGNVSQSTEWLNDILFVVYTERRRTQQNGQTIDVTRLISARMATNFERGALLW